MIAVSPLPDSAAPVGQHPWGRRQFLVATVVAIVATLLLHRGTLLEMLRLWSTSGTYAHGWLVMPLCVGLAWRQRRRLAAGRLRPSAWGLAAVAAAAAAWVAGSVAHALVVQELALVAMVPAIVLAVCGFECVRRLAFPCAFLLFAVPFGEPLTEPLMHVTASGTVLLLELAGIPVFRDGMLFSTSAGDFEVAEACSGIRYLIAFLSIGVLYAYLALRTWPYRIGFALAAVVVPVLANVGRAFVIVLIAHFSDLRHAVGIDHFIYGWLFFAIVMALVLWVGEILRRREARGVADRAGGTPALAAVVPESARIPRIPVGPSPWPAAAAAVCVAIVAAGPIAAAAFRDTLARPALGPRGVPAGSGGWTGPLATTDDWRPLFHGEARVLRADYRHAVHGRVSVALVHYVREGEDGELVGTGHALADPSAWRQAALGTAEIVPGTTVRATRYNAVRSATRLTVWSFYAVNGRSLVSPGMAKVSGTLWRLTDPRQAPALVAVARAGTEDDAASDAALRAFAAEHLPAILACARQDAAGSPCAAAP